MVIRKEFLGIFMKRQIENFSKILISSRDVHTYRSSVLAQEKKIRSSVLSCFKSKLDTCNMHPNAG